MMGVSGVLSRIQELQTHLGVVQPGGTVGTAATGTTFATALTAETAKTAGVGKAVTRSGTTTGDEVVAAAKKYLGTPYRFGSTDPKAGLDCSGLVQRTYADLGIKLPRISSEQAKAGTRVDGLSNAKPGDLLAFSSPVDHIAIYLGDNKMIAASRSGENVKIQSVYEKPSAIRRIVGAAPALDPAAAMRPGSLQSAGALRNVPYADVFVRAGAKYGVSAKLLAAVAKVESGYNPKAVSPAGAQGLMQLMPGTAKGLGVKNSFDPEQAINGAAKLLASHLKEFKTVPLALAAYNAGGGAVHRYGGIPPFSETQAYVPKVQRALAKLG
ncbi:MAG TPA: transglycosylase SLT domain-containing protein [Actinoplanes sp.]|nr:transglycosylase SLT domain-containing protein [Actinoplanes sp.]